MQLPSKPFHCHCGHGWSTKGTILCRHVGCSSRYTKNSVNTDGCSLTPGKSRVVCSRQTEQDKLNRNTLWKPEVSAAFLADLDVICPSADNPKLASSFLNDLQTAYASATAAVSLKLAGISAVDLNFLEKQLNIWRTHHDELLEQYLRQLPSDDPLFNPVSLFGTIDYGRLEIAHTRALAWLLGDHEHGFGSKLIESQLLYLLPGRQISLT